MGPRRTIIAAMVSSDATGATTTLPPDLVAFIQGGASITVSSRDDRLIPSIASGVGCRVNENGDEITLFVFAAAAEALAHDVARQGSLAVVFSDVGTNQTVQIKGRNVTLVPTGPTDAALVRRYMALHFSALRPFGWTENAVQTALGCDPPELLALRFSPQAAFQQSPGPGAGRALALTRLAVPAPSPSDPAR